ncbi:MAG: hypothetical protein ACPGXZ_14040 [Saprospiraceae bacterium]
MSNQKEKLTIEHQIKLSNNQYINIRSHKEAKFIVIDCSDNHNYIELELSDKQLSELINTLAALRAARKATNYISRLFKRLFKKKL